MLLLLLAALEPEGIASSCQSIERLIAIGSVGSGWSIEEDLTSLQNESYRHTDTQHYLLNLHSSLFDSWDQPNKHYTAGEHDFSCFGLSTWRFSVSLSHHPHTNML